MGETLNLLTLFKENTGIDFAYDHFSEGESPDPPFIVYLYPDTDNFGADGSVYLPVNAVRVELYTDKKDPEAESLLEQAFSAAGIFWEKHESWIPEEKLYEVLYEYEEINKYE